MKKDGLKIVTIGGGSSYTPELVSGFISLKDELPVRELWLVDVEEGRKKVEIIAEFAKRMIKAAGVDIEVHTTLDRREALVGADFVTSQFRVGQMDARIRDEKIPLTYGYMGQETNGAGGMFKGLRTIPVILDIVSDIQELCPEAWLVNFTNPAGMVTQAIWDKTDYKRAIGLCNVPLNMKYKVAEHFDVDVNDVYVEFVGLNHMDFIKKVYVDGEDVTKQALDAFLGNVETMKNIKNIPWSKEFIRGLNMIPNDYLRYYFKRESMLAQQLDDFKTIGTRGQQVKEIEKELFEIYKDENLVDQPDELKQRGRARYSEAACYLINSIYNNKMDVQTVNVPNNGALGGLRKDEVAEINCIITSHGAIPVVAGEIPDSVRGIVTTLKSVEHMVIDAAVDGDFEKMSVAMAINPLVANDLTGNELLEEMLEANKKYLPAFNK